MTSVIIAVLGSLVLVVLMFSAIMILLFEILKRLDGLQAYVISNKTLEMTSNMARAGAKRAKHH